MKPTPTPAERVEAHESRPARSRVQYPWHLIKLGEWQEWQSLPDNLPTEDARLTAGRLRAAASDHASRHGLTVRSRSTRQGRTVDLLFQEDARA